MAVNENFPLALSEGTVLAGMYVINKVLGQGGFGITYMAENHKTGEKVAVKEFFPDTLVRREASCVISYQGEREENFNYGKESFLQEAQTLAQFLGNENIVRIHSYFEENGTAYFVMDYIEGISFDEYLKQKGGKISVAEAEKILIPIMDALEAVHAKGIVHRDVTPDNIYICNDGVVKLLDFGAARYSLGDKSKSLDIILKHGFAPKEQYTRHGRQGPYTDVYSLAATFYFAITGRRPPDSIDRLEEDDLIPPSSLGIDITEYQQEALYKALEVQPYNRFQTMGVFKAVLLNENSANAPVLTESTNTSANQNTTYNTENKNAPYKNILEKLKNFSSKKTAVISAIIVCVGIAGIVGVASSVNKEDVSKIKDTSTAEVFIEKSDETKPAVTTENVPETTKAETTKAVTTKAVTTKAVTTTATTAKKQPATTTVPATSSKNQEVLGNSNGNLLNGGQICYGDGVLYYIDDDWHSIYEGSTRIFCNENETLSNLCYIDNTLYYLNSGRACYIDPNTSDAYYLGVLEDYDNITKMYITEDYYFIYVSESLGDGTLYRLNKSGKAIDYLPVDYNYNFTISDGYIYYTALSTDNYPGVFKLSVNDLTETAYGITYASFVPSYPVVDNGYLYVFLEGDNGAMSVCRYDTSTMDPKKEIMYDVSDLNTDGTGVLSHLNVYDNNIFFTVYNSSTYSLYHITVDNILNGRFNRECLLENALISNPNIIEDENGNIQVHYMMYTNDNSSFELYYRTFDSNGNSIENN
ncbi:MAG: protein kinase [Ruminococcus flavefaciens]|nr:protein kinase [Ruminococcus flavefaciens]